MVFFLLISCIFLLIVYVYYIGRRNELYWIKRNVPFYAMNRVFGPFWELTFGNRAFFQILGDFHKKYPDAPCVGTVSITDPILVVTDPKNIQYVTEVDFESFCHRGLEIEASAGLADSVLMMNGKKWKLARKNLTTLFSAAKLRKMYTTMDKCAQDFVVYLNDHPEKLKGDVCNTLSTFCSAAIATSVFGITTESIFDSPFLEIAQKAIAPSSWSNVRMSIMVVLPWLFRLLKLKLFTENEQFFTNAVKQLTKEKKEEIGKNTDFAELCLNLQNKGEITDDETGFSIKTTDKYLAAQAFFFFLAGVEPSATTLFCVLLELGRNPDILERVHNEIDEIFEKNHNNVTYDNLNEFKYLQMVIEEGLRMYPPNGILTRQCVKDAVLPVGNIRVDKGTKIFINVFAVQRDRRLFAEPNKFIPERFSEDSKLVIDPLLMSFGKGNRTCVGERFAKTQVATGLVHLLRKFSVKTRMQDVEIKFSNDQLQTRPSNVDLEFIPRLTKTY